MALSDGIAAAFAAVGTALKAVRSEARQIQGMTSVPPTTWWIAQSGMLSVANGTLVQNRLNMTPLVVGPQGWTTDQVAINVGVAGAGTALQLDVGIYKDDGTGRPDGAQQLATASFTALTTTGVKTAAWSTPVALAPGRYWIVSRYSFSSQTTVLQLSCVSNNVWAIPSPGTTFPPIRAFTLASQSALPTTTLGTLSISGSNDAPAVLLRRSA